MFIYVISLCHNSGNYNFITPRTALHRYTFFPLVERKEKERRKNRTLANIEL